MRYFLYARKSTDVEDKQILSIDAQLLELRSSRKKNGKIETSLILESLLKHARTYFSQHSD